MPTFIITMNWTEQGIRNVKDAPKRAAAAREMAKKLGVEIKQTYLTNGDFDLFVHRRIGQRRQCRQVLHGNRRSSAMCARAPCGPGPKAEYAQVHFRAAIARS